MNLLDGQNPAKRKAIVTRLSDIPPYVPPEFPRISGKGRDMTLEVEAGRHYDVPETPLEFLGLVRHLAKKTWVDREFIRLAIARVALARDWKLGSLANDMERLGY